MLCQKAVYCSDCSLYLNFLRVIFSFTSSEFVLAHHHNQKDSFYVAYDGAHRHSDE